jgi:CcmD family protein
MAETTNYMIAGYCVIFGVMALYVASLVMRLRSLRAEMKMLEETEEKAHK